ncbi:CpaF family protein [Paenibacillus aurantius]|uniref:CpaF family protein n=1 Tax=Paenibacillus aurantius TaxID=2918900 RepID=A0AA96RHP7_9BACL|nr:CpaF family protein [Paenibacillus aurantius]WNQ14262.1 CpaF family protein [Paenibacillus aurantius]
MRRNLVERLDRFGSVGDDQLKEWIDSEVLEWAGGEPLTASAKKRIADRLFHSFRGLDVLQPLMEDRSISEVMINRHDEVFIEQNGRVSRSPVRFESAEKLEDVIQSIVAKVNRVVNDASPIVDARLSDGSRVNVVLPPIALKGPTMTIRKFPDRPITVEELIRLGAIPEEAAEMLRRLVQAHYNIFIGGGTGSGKTTFLNALARFIPEDERVITIEDSAELHMDTIPNLVSLETRNANTEGKGEITIRDLIRSSLRMRPNRIIVGEVRGAEAMDMLQAMNTGHDGSLSTGHANSSVDMISRLETMVLSGADLPLPVVRSQIASALDIIIHLSRLKDKSRKVTEIQEVAGIRNGEVVLHPLYIFSEEEGGRLVPTGRRLLPTEKAKKAGLCTVERDAG